METTLYIEARKSDLTPSMQFSSFPFHSAKDTKKKKKNFTSALHILVIKNV